MTSTATEYGDLIRRHRVHLGLSQRRLADRCGISDSAVAHIERKIRLPSESLAGRIAEALDLPEDQRAEVTQALAAARDRQTRERVRARSAFREVAGATAASADPAAMPPGTNADDLLWECQLHLRRMREQAPRELIEVRQFLRRKAGLDEEDPR